MKQILLISLLLITSIGWCQNVINVDKGDANRQLIFSVVDGNALKTDKYIRIIEGSPYFRKDWMKGQLQLANGKFANTSSMRLDLIDNSVEYLDQFGQIMIATTPVTKSILTDSITGESFYFINSELVPELNKIKKGWFQLLDSSNIGLYKLITKIIDERRPYNSATYEQIISDGAEYYLPYNKAIYRIKKLADIVDLLKDRKTELEIYISQKKLKGKKDTDYISLLSYYNSLHIK